MKRFVFLSALFLASFTVTTRADDPPVLPPCASLGDKDLDGVSDESDSDEADSCLLSTSGFEDCGVGAGDGIPDCQ